MSTSKLCTLVPTGPDAATITAVTDCPNGYPLVADGVGNVWASCNIAYRLIRVTPGNPAILGVGLPDSRNAESIAISPGKVWATQGNFIYPFAY
jgi:hypothetical protein